MLCTQRGEMGNIFSRTEPVKTECPGCIMATKIVNITQPPHSPWMKAANQIALHFEKDLTQSDNQTPICLTTVSQTTAAITSKGTTREQNTDSLLNEELTGDTNEESPLESFSEKETLDDWWNSSLFSEDDKYQLYEADQSEDTPYWLSHERENNNANGNPDNCFNRPCSSSLLDVEQSSEISEPLTAFSSPGVQDLLLTKNDNGSLTKTEQKIRNLKALLAEQEKQISRLKSESKERTFQSKEPFVALKDGYGYRFNGNLYGNARDKLTAEDDDFYKEQKITVTESTRRKRIGHAEHVSLSNTKRFRYRFRKDVPQEINSYLDGITEQKRTLFKGNSAFQVLKPDIRKESFSQDEFLSLFRLVRTTVADERIDEVFSN